MRLVFLFLVLTILYPNNSFSYSTISVKLGDNKSKIKFFKPMWAHLCAAPQRRATDVLCGENCPGIATVRRFSAHDFPLFDPHPKPKLKNP